MQKHLPTAHHYTIVLFVLQYRSFATSIKYYSLYIIYNLDKFIPSPLASEIWCLLHIASYIVYGPLY